MEYAKERSTVFDLILSKYMTDTYHKHWKKNTMHENRRQCWHSTNGMTEGGKPGKPEALSPMPELISGLDHRTKEGDPDDVPGFSGLKPTWHRTPQSKPMFRREGYEERDLRSGKLTGNLLETAPGFQEYNNSYQVMDGGRGVCPLWTPERQCLPEINYWYLILSFLNQPGIYW